MSIRPLSRLLLVAYFIEAGLVLIVVPWSTFWDRNAIASSLPIIAQVMSNNFVRGAVSGLGIVTICAGLYDLAHIMSGWRVLRRPAGEVSG